MLCQCWTSIEDCGPTLKQLWNCIPLEIKNSKSSQSFRKQNENFIFRPSFSILNLCVPACWIYELERQTDNDNEPDSDLQRLGARDTDDSGVLEVYHYIHFHFILFSLWMPQWMPQWMTCVCWVLTPECYVSLLIKFKTIYFTSSAKMKWP